MLREDRADRVNGVVSIQPLALKSLESLDDDWLLRSELVLHDHVNRRMQPEAGEPKTGPTVV
jgi:hypothetical protein